MRLPTHQFYFAITLLISLCALPAPAQGRSTAGDYAKRLAMAERLVNEAVEQDSPSWELAPMASEVKRLLPASEEVEFNGAIIHVDNAWFHEAVNNVVKTAGGDVGRRGGMLGEISARLARLRESVKADQTAEDRAEQDQRARLDHILARAEYLSEEKRESSMVRWFRQITYSILRLLARLFGGAASRAPRTGVAGFVLILRALIFLVVIAALTYGAAKLVQRFQPRPKQPKEPEAREALGEEIAEDATAAELFATASELARQGEYRKAIRRAYIALLCDFDRRGKLRLGRSKTNRDYLDALRPERRIYATFSVMTFAFERAWYGQEHATEEEFRNFVELYQEAIK
jgi:Na+-transporting methylmalonyl-CoA/oxaloacetate decarboxylase gamma subunit